MELRFAQYNCAGEICSRDPREGSQDRKVAPKHEFGDLPCSLLP